MEIWPGGDHIDQTEWNLIHTDQNIDQNITY